MSARERADSASGFVGLAFVWIASAAPFLLDSSLFSGVSRCALAALPWLVWSGVPRADRADLNSSSNDIVAPLAFEFALFAPMIALGAWVDLADAFAARAVATTVAFAWIASLVLASASRIAARSPRARTVHALAWFVLVALGPLLGAALTLGGAPSFGAAPSWVRMLTNVSPLAWICERLPARSFATNDAVQTLSSLPWFAIVGVLVILSLALASDRVFARASELGDGAPDVDEFDRGGSS